MLSLPDIRPIARLDDRILITGSNGFIGSKIVELLLEYGFTNLCCFVRPFSRLDRLKSICDRYPAGKNVQFVTGDLLSREDCVRAARDVAVVYHLAAGFDKSFAGAFMNSVLTTRNLIDAFLEHGNPKRFVNVSSFAVYSNYKLSHGDVLDETCELESQPEERYDAYGFGKLKQEEIVREYGRTRNLPFVILRPGTVYGPGKEGLSGRVGIDTFGFFVQINGSNYIPMTFVDNCADAIILAGLAEKGGNQTFNVVDDEVLTGRQYLKAYKKKVRSFRSIWVPYFIAYILCFAWEKYSRWSNEQLPPVFNRRRCSAEWKKTRFSNRRLREVIGWSPRINLKTALESLARPSSAS